MQKKFLLAASITLAGTAAFVGQLTAASQFATNPKTASSGFSATPIGGGPDVICGDTQGIQNWGGLAGQAAYSLGTVSCNVGTSNLAWQQGTNLHPVMPQNIYRIETVNGATRIEQIGQSWLKHGFCALQQTLCGACIPVPGGCASALGVGCSDPYTPARNGTQNNMGPRYDINASTGVFTIVPPAAPITTMPPNLLGKRVVVTNTELDPALHPGAQYWGECQYVHQQDAGANNNDNNASRRRITVGALTGVVPNQAYQLSYTGPTTREECALFAWKAMDASVTIVNVDVPGDGRYVVAYDVTETSPGTWHYEYAIYNLNSHRSGEKVILPVPAGVTVTNIEFKDIDYHTQSLLAPLLQVDNVNWNGTRNSSDVTWNTSAYTGTTASGGNENTANALRWGTTYNFRFDANTAPVDAMATIDLFRPGAPDSVTFTVKAPSPAKKGGCPADLDGSGTVNGLDLANLLAGWGPC
jgi:hypothetical protein